MATTSDNTQTPPELTDQLLLNEIRHEFHYDINYYPQNNGEILTWLWDMLDTVHTIEDREINSTRTEHNTANMLPRTQ